jgi:nitroreductase
MCTEAFDQQNTALDRILAERRSHRVFRPEFPSDDEIRRILHAGLLAPFAAASVGSAKDYFRQFFVFRRGSRSMDAAVPLVRERVFRMADELEKAMEHDATLRAKAVTFAHRLS